MFLAVIIVFFGENEIVLELLGVFKLERGQFLLKNAVNRNYDSISLRLNGRGHFKTSTDKLSVAKGDLLYIPKNESYSQRTTGETIIAIHFINYTFDKAGTMEKSQLPIVTM